jgi:hypothetical protein
MRLVVTKDYRMVSIVLRIGRTTLACPRAAL